MISRFTGLNSVVRGVAVGFAGVFSAQGIFSELKGALNFSAMLEDAQLAIAAILRLNAPQQFATFGAAMSRARTLLEQLKQAAQKSPATFEDLAEAYKGMAGVMMSAGIPLEKQIDLITAISQAAAAVGLPANQLLQEARALLTGNIDRSAFLAKNILRVTSEDITIVTQQGKLFDFLMQKLAPFSEAAERAGDSWNVLWSNLGDIWKQRLAEETAQLFERIKGGVRELTEFVKSANFSKLIEDLRIVLEISSKLLVGILGLRIIRGLAPVMSGLGALVSTIKFAVEGGARLGPAIAGGLGVALQSVSKVHVALAALGTTAVSFQAAKEAQRYTDARAQRIQATFQTERQARKLAETLTDQMWEQVSSGKMSIREYDANTRYLDLAGDDADEKQRRAKILSARMQKSYPNLDWARQRAWDLHDAQARAIAAEYQPRKPDLTGLLERATANVPSAPLSRGFLTPGESRLWAQTYNIGRQMLAELTGIHQDLTTVLPVLSRLNAEF
jgi:hypothetical protein